MDKKEMLVSALEAGTVIDHIPSDKLMDIIETLNIEDIKSSVTIGYNLESKKMGRKSIIKISDKFFTNEELSQLSVIAPNLTLCIIKNYNVVEKRKINLPDELFNIVKCPNPKCVSNNEPMASHFHVINKEHGILKCHYCEKEHNVENIKLK
ncbi:MAG: aspartate carbamoyltransferase regulatory subunit [Prevotellaceae bacterium]|nr:aspartate carbamoyltransferase regulatory subunit [Candidatus Faecinaster equi]